MRLKIGDLYPEEMGAAWTMFIGDDEIRIGNWHLKDQLFPWVEDDQILLHILTEETIHHAIAHVTDNETSWAFDNIPHVARLAICGEQ